MRRAIDSIFAQTYKSWEVIVVDDGSTDNTRDIINSYPQVKYLFQENQGVSSARNEGARIANGEWLIFLDSDDELLSGSLRRFNDSIQSDEKVEVWLSGIEFVIKSDAKPKLPGKKKYHPTLAGAFSIRKKIFDHFGGYDNKLKFSENMELFHRINLAQTKMGIIEEVTVRYFDSLNGTSKNMNNKINALSLILTKHKDTLTSHQKYLFYQIIGVIFMRFSDYKAARRNLCIAFKYKPFKLPTLIRIGISFFPIFAKMIYKEKISN